MPRTVSRADLEAALAELQQGTPDPQAGIHDPGSIAWAIGREPILFLGAGRAALLQLAHPMVAYAIDHHSATRRDPIGRFNRTFLSVYAMVFGDLRAACRAARHVHAIHGRVTGTIAEDVGRWRAGAIYRADDAEALYWVHATLVDTSVRVYELVVRPLSAEEKDAYVRESNRFARLFGIPWDMLPTTWADFSRGFARTLESDAIAVSTPASEIAAFLLTPPNPVAVAPIRWMRTMTAGLLPARLRAAFGLPFGRADRLLYAASIASLRRVYPRLPDRLRRVPAAVEAERRLAGRPAPDRLGRTMERLVLSALRP